MYINGNSELVHVFVTDNHNYNMKCSGNSKDGSPCDYTSEKPFRFCPQCGESPLIEIPCPGRDNAPCGEPITVKFKFCPGCGLKIDQTLFTKPRKKCPQCDADVPEGKKFCAECGARITSTNSDSD